MRAGSNNNGSDTTEDEEERNRLNDRVRPAAATYAWEYFKYHARQRQEVFRFFIIIVGSILAGYIASSGTEALNGKRYIFGLLLIVVSALFKRLDQRSHALIKLSETYLKDEEQLLQNDLNKIGLRGDDILILTKADYKEGRGPFPLNYIATFRQIYTVYFIIITFLGLYITYSEGMWGELLKVSRSLLNCF
jgi:hypothetical protein